MTFYLDCLMALIALVVLWTAWPRLRQLGSWLRYLLRLARFKATKRMPRYDGPRQPDRALTASEFIRFRKIAAGHRRGTQAQEPDYGRRA